MREPLICKTIQSLGCGTESNYKCQGNIIHYSLNVLEQFNSENDNALIFSVRGENIDKIVFIILEYGRRF